ncbi:hypothetical protein D9M68_868280 [compost metagenome]
MPGDIGAGRVEEELHGVGDIIRRADAFYRHRILQPRLHLRIEATEQRSVDYAGGDHVDRDALGGELDRQAAAEAHHPALGGGVVGLAETTQPGAGGQVDDTPEATLQHQRQSRLAAEELRPEVAIHHQVPVLLGHVQEALVAHHSGIVHQEIQSGARLGYLRECTFD